MKLIAAVIFALSLTTFAADKNKNDDKPKPVTTQPATETLDLDAITRIRDEGMNHSHVMDYASGLFDGVGARLTGSPDFAKAVAWTQDQLTRMGASNPRAESWGDFGMGWQQIGTSVQMTAPGTATFLAQATPWTPATAGEITAQVIAIPTLEEEKDFDKWKGKLSGKIILYGTAPKIDPDLSIAVEHDDQAKLDHFRSYPLDGNQADSYVFNAASLDGSALQKRLKARLFREKIGHFFADEHVAAVLVPGGFGGVLDDDTGAAVGWNVYLPEHKQAIPSAVIASEAFGRMQRLASHDVPVSVRLNIQTEFSGDHVEGQDVFADIPGTDPALKDQVVMMGGHLDSWIAGTGATDNGAGVIIALEAMRILKTLNIQPRRTIRIGLWGGEEQGLLGSVGYAKNHFGTHTYSTKPEDVAMPEFIRKQVGPIVVKPEHEKFDAYFNADNGTGKFLGIFAEGNSAAANIFQQWAAPINDLGFTTISLRNTGSTDHVTFDGLGLPGFQFIQDPRDYEARTHHTNLDTYERLSQPDLKQAAVIMAIFVYNAAQRDAMMPRKPMPHPELEEQQRKPLEGIYPTTPKP
ncbi:MAG TPA: M20/M25/M40 family metallo-hydrolase [Terriglobales bacterium]|nr:M20/M25/M40 family metallo-hydrolase [Terriglobales bacterium]